MGITGEAPTWVVQRYVALGDSFTAGTGGPEAAPVPTLEQPGDGSGVRWADRLAELLRAANPRLDYHNLAVAGAQSEEVAAAQVEVALRLRPDLVTLICGANDVLHSVRPDIAGYAATFSGMLARLRSGLPRAALVTATTPDFSSFLPLRPRTRERVARGIRDLNEATRATAARRGVLCLEFAGHPEAGDRTNFAADGIHASAAGHERAAIGAARALAQHFGIHVPVPSGDGGRTGAAAAVARGGVPL